MVGTSLRHHNTTAPICVMPKWQEVNNWTILSNLSTDFSQVLQDHAALLGRVAATYEANFHLRQELLQEISLAVWQALEKFKIVQ